MNRQRVVHAAAIAAVAALALGLSWSQKGIEGFLGSSGGVTLALALAVVNRRFHAAAREAQGQAIVRSVMAGFLVTFGAVGASVLAVAVLFPRVAACFGLTLVVVHITIRFLEGWVEFSRGRSPGEPVDSEPVGGLREEAC